MSRSSQAPARPGTGKKATSRRSKAVRVAHGRVLAVAADPAGLRRVRESLGDEWVLTTAAGEGQAQILLDAFEYHALIAFHEPSIPSGIRVLEWARARYPRVRRLLISDREPATFAPHLLSGLIQRFLPEPVDRAGLLAALAEGEP